jgi:hypothetical protein
MTASGVILRSRRSYARFSGSENGVRPRYVALERLSLAPSSSRPHAVG